jgi:hypothetical protein
MKKLSLFLLCLAMAHSIMAQTYSPDFLDGRIMFKLKSDIEPKADLDSRTDNHSFSLVEHISSYPKINDLLGSYGI